jgi:hypothetical protein
MNCRILPCSIICLYLSLGILLLHDSYTVSAQTPRTTDCAHVNATGNSTGVYGNSPRPCPAQLSCEMGYSTCLGTSAAVNCTLAAQCIAERMSCFNTAASDVVSCVGLNQLQLAQVAVASGQVMFNMTDVFKSCLATSCHLLNSSSSGLGSNCTLNYQTLCPSPVNTAVTLLLQGPFLPILVDSSQRAAFSNALGADLTNAFRIVTTVNRLFIAGSRRQAQQSVVAEVEVEGVSASYAPFRAAFGAVAGAPNEFLPHASALFMSFTGQPMTVLKIGIGSSSSAFSYPGDSTVAPPVTSIPTPGPVATPQPPTSTSQPNTTTTTAPTATNTSSTSVPASTASSNLTTAAVPIPWTTASTGPQTTPSPTSTIFTATITPSFSLSSFLNLLAVKIGCSTSDISASVSNGVVTFSFTSGDVSAYNAAARTIAASPTEESALGVTGMAAQSIPVTASPSIQEPGSSMGIIVGASVGGGLALICLIAAVVFCIRRQNSKQSEMAQYSDQATPMMDDR